MIDRATVDRIIDAAQIVDVVSDFVTLRKRGVNYVGLCPFHDDKTPSFYVSPAKGVCKCFSCGKGGSAVHFIMEHEQLTYAEALKYLARKYGIEVRERDLTDDERRAQSDRESLFVVNQFALDYFRDILRSSPQGRAVGMAYLRSRGFRDDIIEKFQLGYSTDARDGLAAEATRRGYKKEYLLKTGLCYETDDHHLRDRFAGRVIFPVFTLSGKVVAFGGRVLAAATKGVKAKYVNSTESDIYHKSNELYGIYQAKAAIVKQDRCYLVEGYTDVISMYQAGIENVVASSGTALTTGQIKLIRRFTQHITVLYDGDEAGIKASLRGIDLLLAERLHVRVCLLPDGDDPDSLARRLSPKDLQAFLDAHSTDFIRFKTDLLMRSTAGDPIQRAGVVGSVVDSIAVIPEAIERDVYIRECAQLMGIEDRLLVAEVARRRRAAYLNRRAEQDRQAAQQTADNKEQITNPSDTPTAPADTPSPADTPRPLQSPPAARPIALRPNTAEERLAPYELALLTVVVRYGEQPLDFGDEDDEGAEPVSVVRFIADDLSADGIALARPLHRRLLEEVLSNVDTADFRAAHFLLSHPDTDLSRLATDLMSDRYELSRYHERNGHVETDQERLPTLVPQLINNYKYALIAEELRQIETRLQDPAVQADATQCNDLLTRYNDLRTVQAQMAQALGDRVVMRV